jgi:hypothetical protein
MLTGEVNDEQQFPSGDELVSFPMGWGRCSEICIIGYCQGHLEHSIAINLERARESV